MLNYDSSSLKTLIVTFARTLLGLVKDLLRTIDLSSLRTFSFFRTCFSGFRHRRIEDYYLFSLRTFERAFLGLVKDTLKTIDLSSLRMPIVTFARALLGLVKDVLRTIDFSLLRDVYLTSHVLFWA